MSSRIVFAIGAILMLRFDLASGQTELAHWGAPNIRTVASDTLADLAMAVADSEAPVIFYNPRLMERYGVELSAFVMAHEEAHIRLGHRRPHGGVSGAELERLLQGFELDADCLAAARLAHDRPAALQAAIAFFQRMGREQYDREHPTGSARAFQLAACGNTKRGDPRRSGEGPLTVIIGPSFR